MTWMTSFLEARNDIDFTGYDFVDAIIDQNKNKFSNTSWNFEVVIFRSDNYIDYNYSGS